MSTTPKTGLRVDAPAFVPGSFASKKSLSINAKEFVPKELPVPKTPLAITEPELSALAPTPSPAPSPARLPPKSPSPSPLPLPSPLPSPELSPVESKPAPDEPKVEHLKKNDPPEPGLLPSSNFTITRPRPVVFSLVEKEPTPEPTPEPSPRIYDRGFLLQFQKLFKEKPEGLPDLEAIISPGRGRKTLLVNNRTRTTGAKSGNGSARTPKRQASITSKSGGKVPIRSSLTMADAPVVPLEVTANRYVVRHDVEAEEKIKRTFQSILNKLTPEKFETLLEQVKQIKIDTVELLKMVVVSVFEKALAEPAFSPTYAEFCARLQTDLPSFDEPGQQPQNFKRLILNRCQAEFESKNTEPLPDTATEEEKVEHEAKNKKRMLGTIRFIGELFCRKILTAKIIKSCVTILFGEPDNLLEENLEALCKLLETVGSLLDKNDKQFVSESMAKLQDLATQKQKISSRLRFMMQDTVDLRGRGWTQRENLGKEEAKKLSDVHKDATKQKPPTPSSAAASSKPVQRSTKIAPIPARQKKVDRYSTVRSPQKPSPSNNDWTTASSGKNKKKGGPQDIRASSTSASPTRGSSSGKQSPVFGATKIATRPTARGNEKDDKKTMGNPKPGNTFAIFSNDGDGDEGESGEEPEGEDGGEEVQEEEVVEESLGDLSAEDFDGKVQSAFKEFLSNYDFGEAMLCVTELNAPGHHPRIVPQGLLLVLEEGPKAADELAKLFVYLNEKRVLTTLHLESGFADFLETAQDIALDYPLVVNVLGSVLGVLICQEAMTLAYLTSNATAPLTPKGDRAKLVAHAMKAICKEDADNALRIWQAAQLTLDVLGPPETVQSNFDKAGVGHLLTA